MDHKTRRGLILLALITVTFVVFVGALMATSATGPSLGWITAMFRSK